ncbi:unnamed protein product [Prunus armeniaca]
MTPHLAWPSLIFNTMSTWRFFQNMVLARHCCSPWTQSSVSSVADLVGVSVSPPSKMAKVGFGVGFQSMGVGYVLRVGVGISLPKLEVIVMWVKLLRKQGGFDGVNVMEMLGGCSWVTIK